MATDLLVRNVTVVAASGRRVTDIAIAGGRIAGLLAPGSTPFVPAVETIDASRLFALPGLIDGHVHFRSPGLEHEEDWLTGTRAAVFGGVTTVLDMPNTVPPTDSVDRAREKLALADASAYCDFGLFGLVGEGSDSVADLAGSGLVVGLKVFLGLTTGGLAAPDDDGLRRALIAAAASGLRVAFHAEDRAIIADAEAGLRAADRMDAIAHLESRPVEAEVAAIDHAGRLLAETGAAGHVLHLSSAAGLARVAAWRQRGVDLTCEVTPHHLLLGKDAYELGGLAKVNPPIRGEPDASQLLAALSGGQLDCVASDHAPHTAADKSRPNIWDVSAGFAGVETLLPLMLNAVNDGRLSLERLVHATSEAPAKTWGLWPRKGAIAVGADADLTLVDLDRVGTIRAADLQGKNNLSPFEGRAMRGEVVLTIVRGHIVVRDGQLVGEPGWGQPLRTNSFRESIA
ncbi:MAG: dihydroorotase family protein [Chloroflexota bacterium]